MTTDIATVSVADLNWAIAKMNSGDGAGVDYLSTQSALTQSTEYREMLRDAAVVSFHEPSVEAGVIAGLRLASILLNQDFEFLQETA